VDFCNKIPLFWPLRVKALAIGLLFAAAHGCFGQDFRWESAGARFGFAPTGAGRDFHQADAFANLDLPWNWDLGSKWRLQSRLDLSAGWIGESSANAGIFTLGPTLVLGRRALPLSFECGISPTVLTRSDFPDKDFGLLFQFTSHGGINWDISRHLRLSYRLQHMSNADLSRHNPGLNLHMLGLSYLF
jgi:hypothetical protein